MKGGDTRNTSGPGWKETGNVIHAYSLIFDNYINGDKLQVVAVRMTASM